MKQIKLQNNFSIGSVTIPAGTVLAFSNEGLCKYKGLVIADWQVPACEANGSEIAERLVKQLTEQFPDGFDKNDLIDKFGDKIDGSVFNLMQVDDESVLMLKTPDDEAIELYLIQGADKKYKLDGEYHVASDARQSMAVERFLQTKSSLALSGLVSHIAGILDDVQSLDKPRIMRILRVASQAVNSSKPSTYFLQNIEKGIIN